MTESHTPTPWEVREIYPHDIAVAGTYHTIARAMLLGEQTKTRHQRRANAAFIVRACNAHDELVAALDEALTILEYRLALDADKVFDAAQHAFGKIVVGKNARDAWAETAPKVVTSARAALAKVMP